MVSVHQIAPTDLPTTVYTYPDVSVGTTDWGTVKSVQLKRTQGVLRYTLIADALTLSGGTSPASLVSNSVPVATHVKVTADDDILFDVDMIPWLEYLRLVQGLAAAQTGFEFDIDMCDLDYRRRGQMLPGTLLRSFQYNQLQMDITLNAAATVASGAPTTETTVIHITEEDINRSLCEKFPTLVVKKLQGTVTNTVASGDNDQVNAFPQTGALKAALLYAKSTGTTASNTIVTKIQLILNDSFTETSTTWLMLQRQNRALFGLAPNTGFALKVWSADAELGKMLNIADVRKVTSVDLRLTNGGSNTTDTVQILRILYK